MALLTLIQILMKITKAFSFCPIYHILKRPKIKIAIIPEIRPILMTILSIFHQLQIDKVKINFKLLVTVLFNLNVPI